MNTWFLKGTADRSAKAARSRFVASGRAATVALLTMGLLSPAAHALDARTITEKGAGPNVPACAQCHGANGEGMAAGGFPRLAGQDKTYLVKQLEDFRNGHRANPIMEPIAKALDASAIPALAAFYASLRVDSTSPGGTAPSTRGGQVLASRGDWDHEIPPCTACHGARLQGIPPHFPAIAGQNATYTAKQLHDWKAGTRSNDPQGLMKAVAGRLSDAQIDAVAAYLASPSASESGR